VTATIVRSLHHVFSERGLYEELDGVQTPAHAPVLVKRVIVKID